MDDNEKDDPKAEKEWYVIVLGWIETVEPRAELWSLEAQVRPCDPLVHHRPPHISLHIVVALWGWNYRGDGGGIIRHPLVRHPPVPSDSLRQD